MTRKDAAAFADMLKGLAEVFNVELTRTRTELYFRALEDLPIDILQRAAKRVLKEKTFFPKPAEVRALAQPLETEAELAWMTLLEAFQDSDGYSFPEPEDGITRALIRVYWGNMPKAWEWWRTAHDLALEHKQDEFVERYQDYRQRPPEELPRLPGGGILEAFEEGNRRRLSEKNP